MRRLCRGRTSVGRGSTVRPGLEACEERLLPSFGPAVLYPAGSGPTAVVTADLTGDGRPDLVVANSQDNSVTVFLGNGNGTFPNGVPYAAGAGPGGIAVGDFNGDGHPDLAVADANGGTVSVLVNAGNGTFLPAAVSAAGGAPGAVAAADLNGDGKADLVTVSSQGNAVSVLLGKGDGTFGAPATFATGALPTALALGDFNGDGHLDVVTANFGNNNVSVLLGQGDGTLAPAVPYAVGSSPSAVAVADVDGNGSADIAAANFADGTVSVLKNGGTGTFLPAVTVPAGGSPSALKFADFNGDGRPDLLVANEFSDQVSVLVNQGGSFAAPASSLAGGGSRPVGVAAADLNGDGRLDVVTADNQGKAASVLLDRAFVRPAFATGADAGGGPDVRLWEAATGQQRLGLFAYDSHFLGGVRVATGDVTGDGVPDLVTAPGPGGGPDIRVYDGVSGALVREFMAYDPHFLGGVFIAAGDVNGDGRADVITGPDLGGGPDVRVFDGGTGTLIEEFPAYDGAFLGGVRVAAGDVSGDGAADIVTAPGPTGGPEVRVWDGKTLGLLRDFMAYDPALRSGVYVAAGDVNGDGKADVITGAGSGAGPHVQAFSGADGVVLQSFMAFDAAFQGGARVGFVGDANGDGGGGIVVGAGPGGGPQVQVFDGGSLAVLDSLYAYDPAFAGGVFVGGG